MTTRAKMDLYNDHRSLLDWTAGDDKGAERDFLGLWETYGSKCIESQCHDPTYKQVAAGTPHRVHGSIGDPEYGFDDVSLS